MGDSDVSELVSTGDACIFNVDADETGKESDLASDKCDVLSSCLDLLTWNSVLVGGGDFGRLGSTRSGGISLLDEVESRFEKEGDFCLLSSVPRDKTVFGGSASSVKPTVYSKIQIFNIRHIC